MVTQPQRIAVADLYRAINAGLFDTVTAAESELSPREHAGMIKELDTVRQVLHTHWRHLHGMGDPGLAISGQVIAVVGWLEAHGVLPDGLRQQARDRLTALLDELSRQANIPPYHRTPDAADPAAGGSRCRDTHELPGGDDQTGGSPPPIRSGSLP